MGLNPTDDIIDSKIRAHNLHHKTVFTFGQLAHLWHSMLQDLTDEDELLRRAFQFFDKDGNGEISVQELKTTMHELGDLLTEEEISAFMAIMDVNNDGAIGYAEFLETLKTQTADTGLGDLGLQRDASSVTDQRPTLAGGAPQFDAQPLNVPAGATPVPTPTPFAQQQAAALALDGPGAVDSGAEGSAPASADLAQSGSLGGAAAVAALGPQVSMRRQPSLKPSLSAPPPAAAEPLLDGLQRPPSRIGGSPQKLPPLERAAPQQRPNDAAPAGGLRAPSTLELQRGPQV